MPCVFQRRCMGIWMSEPASGILAAAGTGIGTAVAQIAGQLVSLSFMASMPWHSKLVTIAAGLASAHYSTQAVLYFFPQHASIEEIIGFACGLFGMAIIKATLDAIPVVAKHFSENFSWKK